MKIVLVDDDKEEMNDLLIAVEEGFKKAGISITELSLFYDSDSFLKNFTNGRFDLVILDIYIDQLTGIDIAHTIRKIDKEVRIAFCTSSNNFASEAFDVNACSYALKPLDADKICQMVKKMHLDELIRNRYIFLPDNQRILLRTVIYCECVNHDILFHLNTGTFLKTRLQHHKLLELLEPFHQFYSCSKGMIVNFDAVIQKNNDSFIMSNGDIVPISRRNIKDTSHAYEDYLFEKMKGSHN